MQKKSAEKRSQNIKERKLIRQVLEERLGVADLEEIADNLKKKKKSDSRHFEVLQSALGQKPVDKVEMKTDVNIEESTARLKSLFDGIANNDG